LFSERERERERRENLEGLIMMMMMALCSVVLVPMLSLSTFWKCVLVGVWIVYQMVERKNQFVKPSRSLAIVVTGADSGFGKEISIRLANRGFTVFAGMLQKKRNNNKNIIPLQMDVTSFSEVRDAFDRVRAWCDEEKRHVLCVINNAGVQSGCLVEWTSMKDYEMMFQVNTLGTIRVTKTFLPLLFRDSNCMYTRRIVNVTSVNGTYTSFLFQQQLLLQQQQQRDRNCAFTWHFRLRSLKTCHRSVHKCVTLGT